MKEKISRVRVAIVTVMLMVSFGIVLSGENTDIAKAASKKPKLNKTKIELTKGETFKLKLSNSKNVKWSSNKKTIATVNKKGKVTAKKKGNAVISAKYLKRIYKCKVKVSEEIEEAATETTTEKVIPTVAPTATATAATPTVPTAAPTIAPTAAPTITPKPILTPEDNLIVLKEYILNNGGTNSDNNHFIIIKVQDYTFGIVYEATNDRFLFMLRGDYSTSSTALTMYVYPTGNSILTPECLLVNTNPKYGFSSNTAIDINQYSGDADVYFTTNSSVNMTDEAIQELSNSALRLAMSGWDGLLDYKLNMRLSDIGFISYK